MANRRMEFFIGMTVIVIFVAVAVMTVLFGPQQGLFVSGGGQRMKIVFEKANGITNTSKVLKNGVEIGRVYRRELKEDETGKTAQVEVFFELYPGIKIFSNEHAQIRRNLVGDATIEFVKNPPVPNEPNPVELNSSTTITGTPGSDLAGSVSNIEGDLAVTLKSINEAASRLTEFMDNLNTFFGDKNELQKKKEKLERIFTELESTLKSIHQLAGNMNDVVSDKELRQNILAGSAAIPKIVEKVDKLMANANTLTTDIRRTIDRSFSMFEQVEKNLSNLDDFTSALADQGPEFITSLSDSAKKVQTMVGNISNLAENLSGQLKNPESALGLLSDKKTAAAIRRILDNTAAATEKVHPILDDARVFSNKIAHKPSLLIWGGSTYKGAPANSNETGYGFQSKSPNGGFYSSLYKPSDAGTSGGALFGSKSCFSKLTGKSKDEEYADINSATMMDPNSLSYYYQQNPVPEKKSSSCLSKILPGRTKESVGVEWNGYYGEYPQGTVLPDQSVMNEMEIGGSGNSASFDSELMVPYTTGTSAPMTAAIPQKISTETTADNSRLKTRQAQNNNSVYDSFEQTSQPREMYFSRTNGRNVSIDGSDMMVDDGYGNGYNNSYNQSQAAKVMPPTRHQTSRMQSSLKPIYSKIFQGSGKKGQNISSSGNRYNEMPIDPVYAADSGAYNRSVPQYGSGPQYSGTSVSEYENIGQNQIVDNGQGRYVNNGQSQYVNNGQNGSMSEGNRIYRNTSAYQNGYAETRTQGSFNAAGSNAENEKPLIQRIPIARAEKIVETRISPEAVDLEELPSSILRKRSSGERTFSDDGLPMEILN